jgi:hypothetical protein
MKNPRRAFDGNGTEIPPMTLGDMRAHGIRSIDAFCQAIGCGQEATITVNFHRRSFATAVCATASEVKEADFRARLSSKSFR